ncbi:MAG: hypothetical protein ACYSWU_00110 [Planctomycetota bacterium]|jgi:hypothetical protein
MQSIANLNAEVDQLSKQVEELRKGPKSITDEIDKIPGRRVEYMLCGEQTFAIAQNGLRGNPIPMQVSQDGPFIGTHYPVCMWYPSLPSNGVYWGFWRPVWAGWPLPDQANGAVDFDEDIIAISYEISDGGSQRNFQNSERPPLLSMPGNAIPLPVPTLWTPNTVVNFTPIYQRILFSVETPATTQGTLVVGFPGYRIVNM